MLHKANTQGDVEITERLYPVIIRRFARRPHSGGAGQHRGGDGCIRDIEFTTDLDVAILSQRRVVAPYGMAGGQPGERGQNLWFRKKRAAPKEAAAGGEKSEANAEIPGIKERNGGERNGDAEGDWFSSTDYDVINLGGSNQCTMHAGDRIVICTPGGGGYGPADAAPETAAKGDKHIPRAQGSLANWNAAAHSN